MVGDVIQFTIPFYHLSTTSRNKMASRIYQALPPLTLSRVQRSRANARAEVDNLDAALQLLPTNADIIVLGDFNADPGHDGGPLSTTKINSQGKILCHFMSKWNLLSLHLHISESLLSHTFVSDTHSSVSTIDHILCSQNLLHNVSTALTIPDEPLNTSDHFPVVSILKHQLPQRTTSTKNHSINTSPASCNWSGTSAEDIKLLYTIITAGSELGNPAIP